MMGILYAMSAWLNGWRYDLDGWLVRSRRGADPDLTALNRSDLGFVEESAIAVRGPDIAWVIDWSRP